MNDDKSKRRWSRFGLSTLPMLVACVAAVLAGFRIGYDRGYSAGGRQAFDETQHPIVYDVSDLITVDKNGEPDFADIMNGITSGVEMQSWSEVGGPSTIEWIGNGQIVIAQTTKGHEAIRKLLQDVRDGRHKIPISEPRRSADGAPFIRSQNGGVPSNN